MKLGRFGRGSSFASSLANHKATFAAPLNCPYHVDQSEGIADASSRIQNPESCDPFKRRGPTGNAQLLVDAPLVRFHGAHSHKE
ncbi:hypothetical protein EDF62_3020 [Leucobacter luti]|uniref:Uncharacterized protein n=1 Tax=Leucobacter luti TaxID=340320 RepID=A0A4R6RS97_9MICO|nr:hypothetical protein EDF62_3020 [Leucobacter luti]